MTHCAECLTWLTVLNVWHDSLWWMSDMTHCVDCQTWLTVLNVRHDSLCWMSDMTHCAECQTWLTVLNVWHKNNHYTLHEYSKLPFKCLNIRLTKHHIFPSSKVSQNYNKHIYVHMYDHVIELCHSINGTLNTYVQLKSTTMLKYWVVKWHFSSLCLHFQCSIMVVKYINLVYS